MIDPDTPVFPNNAVTLIATTLQVVDADIQIFKRPLRTKDPHQCIGVFATQWTPDTDTQEVNAQFASEPTIGRYMVAVQALVRDADEVRGLAAHSVLSKLVRAVLYRNPTFAVQLRALSVTLLGSTERVQRYGIRTQRYVSNDVQGTFMYLSTLEWYLDTETV